MARFYRPCMICYRSTVVIIALSYTIFELLPPTKKEVNAFARVCLFVSLSVCIARLLKNACMDLDEMCHVDRCRDVDELINF